MDSISLMRIINMPSFAIGGKTIGTLANWSTALGLPAMGALALHVGGSRAPAPCSLRLRHAAGAELPVHPFRTRRRAFPCSPSIGCWRTPGTMRDRLSVSEMLERIIQQSGYTTSARWHEGGRGPLEQPRGAQERRRQLSYAFPPELRLTAFLEELALVSDQDELIEENDRVTLLTLHHAKGLEYPVVFIVGLEENVFPHHRSYEDPDQMEEERRLMYVGITRAKDRLFLVRAFRRMIWGRSEVYEPSRFLREREGGRGRRGGGAEGRRSGNRGAGERGAAGERWGRQAGRMVTPGSFQSTSREGAALCAIHLPVTAG